MIFNNPVSLFFNILNIFILILFICILMNLYINIKKPRVLTGGYLNECANLLI